MTQGELDHLRELCFFPIGVQMRLPKANETIESTRSSEVAFYEATFSAGLHFPIYRTLRKILILYNICPAQLVPNGWRSMIGMPLLQLSNENTFSMNEFSNLLNLFNNPKPDRGQWCFKVKSRLTIIKEYPSNVKGWKKKFFSFLEMIGSFTLESLGSSAF